jgi:hypothetical protein
LKIRVTAQNAPPAQMRKKTPPTTRPMMSPEDLPDDFFFPLDLVPDLPPGLDDLGRRGGSSSNDMQGSINSNVGDADAEGTVSIR